jgi:acetyl esterase/lipase
MKTLPPRVARTAGAFIMALGLSFGFSSSMVQADDLSLRRIEDITWAVQIAERYPTIVSSNITYATSSNFESKLDVYAPRGNGQPKPTLVFFHGGGWLGGFTKEMYPFSFLPFLQLGWTVVNVEYRSSNVSPAPAAVEDALCALRWVGRKGKDYNIDTHKLVLMGQSAGGLLALAAGMIPPASSGLGGPCDYADAYGPPSQSVRQDTLPPRPVAIINWSGVSDVADLADGAHQQGYAAIWLGTQPDRMAVAKLVSPLTYVRKGSPPVITIHGDEDPLVPYAQSIRLHAALSHAGVVNKLVTIPGGGHSLFGIEATRDAWMQVFAFLDKLGLNVSVD